MSPYHHCWVPSSPTTTLGAWSRYLAGTWASNMSDRKSTRLNSSHRTISYAVFCLKKKNKPVQEEDLQVLSRAYLVGDLHSEPLTPARVNLRSEGRPRWHAQTQRAEVEQPLPHLHC